MPPRLSMTAAEPLFEVGANIRAIVANKAYMHLRSIPLPLEKFMAKGQKKSNREVRKPKAEKPPKHNASQPSLKPGGIKGLENMKNS